MVRGFNLFGGGLKGAQRGIAVLSEGSSITIPVSNVDFNNSILISRQVKTESGNTTVSYAHAVLDPSGNNITFTRGASSSNTSHIIELHWELLEFVSLKSKQTGINSINSQTYTIPINSVNTSKSMLFATYSSTTSAAPEYGSYFLEDANTIMVRRLNGITRFAWQLIEFE